MPKWYGLQGLIIIRLCACQQYVALLLLALSTVCSRRKQAKRELHVCYHDSKNVFRTFGRRQTAPSMQSKQAASPSVKHQASTQHSNHVCSSHTVCTLDLQIKASSANIIDCF
jgi:hypothetical protein